MLPNERVQNAAVESFQLRKNRVHKEVVVDSAVHSLVSIHSNTESTTVPIDRVS